MVDFSKHIQKERELILTNTNPTNNNPFDKEEDIFNYSIKETYPPEALIHIEPDFNKIYEFSGVPTFKRLYSDASSFGVYNFFSFENLPMGKIQRNADNQLVYLITLRGKMQELDTTSKLPYKVKSKISNHQKWGFGYEVISISQDVPLSKDDQHNFLRSILTQNQAEEMLSKYPNIIDMILKDEKVDLNNLKGIGDFTWNLIKNKVLENYLIADVLAMLSPYGISYKKIKQLLKEEENHHLLKQKLFNDPYIITEIDGIGFKTADSIALKINPELLLSEQRLKSFILHYLKETGENNGHTWIYKSELDSAIKENVLEVENIYENFIEKEKISKENLLIEEDENGSIKIGLMYYHWIEQEIWNIVGRFNDSEPIEVTQEHINEGISKAEQEQGFIFTKEQRETIINITKNNFNLLSGRAGVGKSSVSRGILHVYEQLNYSLVCCTLSAKAAIRLNETTGFPSGTIHKLLKAKPGGIFEYNYHNQLEQGVYLIDESSMINAYLFHRLLQSIPDGSKIIMVGDHAQIFPIGYGNVFSDLLEKKIFQSNKLTKILRQAEKSGIISDANKIREGKSPFSKKELKMIRGELQDMYYIFRNNRESLNKIAINTFMKSLNDGKNIDDIMILVPRKSKVINSTQEINKKIQSLLFSDNKIYIKYGENKFFIGDKVIHTKNNYNKNVMNGEIGYIKEIDNYDKNKISIVVEYIDKYISYSKSDLKELELAYAITLHRFQGSQCDDIILIIDNTHYMLLSRNFLYTGLTRSVKRCLLLAEPSAYDICIKNSESTTRNTWMKGF